MKECVADITIQRSRSVQDQIREQLREMILSKTLVPGSKLPSTHELAKLWGTHSSTVHSALQTLVREGLLSRAHRAGTFVRKPEEKLTCVGIYYAEDTWTKQSSDFQRAVHGALKEELNRLGVQTQVWVDPRPVEEQTQEWTPLRRAAERREIQGLIGTQGSGLRLPWLNKLPIPSAHLTAGSTPNRVDSDMPQLAELSLRCLAEQGCRSVGLILPVPVAVSNPDGSRNVFAGFYERFTDFASDLGLTVRNEWMRILKAEQPTRNELRRGDWQQEQEHYGYEEFLKLWSRPQRPEGLVVFPDTVARGVITALLEKSVRVPEELRLAIHKNEYSPLLCPLPATFLVSSEREFARALIEQVQKQFRGEGCEPIHVPFRLVAHPAVERTHCGARPAAEPTRSGARHGNSQGRTNKQPNEEGSQL